MGMHDIRDEGSVVSPYASFRHALEDSMAAILAIGSLPLRTLKSGSPPRALGPDLTLTTNPRSPPLMKRSTRFPRSLPTSACSKSFVVVQGQVQREEGMGHRAVRVGNAAGRSRHECPPPVKGACSGVPLYFPTRWGKGAVSGISSAFLQVTAPHRHVLSLGY
jgi:hypothetical protein